MVSKSQETSQLKIRIRLATPADHNAVCNILPDFYDGIDDIPAKYLEYLKDPLRVVMLVEDEKTDKVVSLLWSCTVASWWNLFYDA